MSDFPRLHTDGVDDEIVRGLRELYAPPAGEEYWRSLEARILSRLADGANATFGWWDELDRWMRPALVAAAVAVLAVGVALVRARQMEHEVAYEAMLSPITLPETAVRPTLQGQREATFRYLITSR